MSDWKIKFDGGERILDSDVVAFGRASDNDVAFPQDSNVSRYHAEIECRHGDYFLIDLGSSNGTTLNGKKVEGEVRLAPGDMILFGGTSAVEVISDASDTPEQDAAQAAADTDTPEFQVGANLPPMGSRISGLPPGAVPTATAGQTASGGGGTLLVAGAVCGLAVVCIAVAAVFYLSSTTSSCEAKAVITKPEAGDTIMTPTEVELEAENMGCVSTAVYTLDGEEIQRTDEAPFTVTLDPKDFPEMSDGLDHKLEIVLIDEQGQQIAQNSPVLLAFETRVVAKEEPTPDPRPSNDRPQQPIGTQSKKVTLIEIQEMSNRFVKQFSPNFKYNVNNRQFLEEVQRKTAEYATEGYFERAAQYRDAISVAYVRENNLDAPLGFILAMSRSKFILDKKGKDEGLWKMSNDFVTANGYNGPCGTETLSDASQNCAAKASAIYMKAIVFGVFDGDSIYGASVFGRSTQDAGAWKATLPADRSDIWNTIRTPEERDQIVRFFAAGIVGENPQKFGLTKDRPLSELYRIAM